MTELSFHRCNCSNMRYPELRYPQFSMHTEAGNEPDQESNPDVQGESANH